MFLFHATVLQRFFYSRNLLKQQKNCRGKTLFESQKYGGITDTLALLTLVYVPPPPAGTLHRADSRPY